MQDGMMEQLTTYLNEAGSIALTYFTNPVGKTRLKKDGSAVTDADIRISVLLAEKLSAAYPDIPFCDEEGSAVDARKGTWWVIDPIDATANFIEGNPYFAISVALVSEGVPQLGIVYAPALGSIYTAVRGSGAFKNGEPIQVGAHETVEHAKILLDIGLHERTIQVHRALRESFQERGASMKSKGCASLGICEVADNTSDAFIHRGLNAWDIAAATLVAHEAGAIISGIDGEAKQLFEPGIIVANTPITQQIVSITKAALDSFPARA
jgi:myo-inositol-1(or 4)-monophosphatase